MTSIEITLFEILTILLFIFSELLNTVNLNHVDKKVEDSSGFGDSAEDNSSRPSEFTGDEMSLMHNDEVDEIEKQLQLKMRQTDLYQKFRKDLKLDDDDGVYFSS